MLSFKGYKGYKHQQVLTLNLAHLQKVLLSFLYLHHPILNLYSTVAAYRAKGAAVCFQHRC